MRNPVLLLLCAILIAPRVTNAQWKTSLFSAPSTISSGRDGSESSTLVAPIRPSFTRATPTSHFNLAYRPEIEFLNGPERQTWWNHYLDVAGRHNFGLRTRLDAASSFVQNSDPARLFADNIFVMPRSNFRELANAITLGHELSRRNSMALRFDNTFTRIEGVDGTFLKQYGVVGTAGLSRYFTARHKVTASYSLLKFSPYEFGSTDDAARFLSNVPTVRAGISRFAFQLALAAAISSPTPSGMLSSGGKIGPGLNGVTQEPTFPTGEGAAGATPTQTASTTPATAPSAPTSGRGPATSASTAPPPASAPPPTTAPPPPSNSAPGPLLGIISPPPLNDCKGKKKKDCEKTPTAPSGTTTQTFGAQPFATVTTNGTTQMLGDPFHAASMTYTYAQGSAVLFQVSGGAMRDRNMAYILGTEVERRFDRVWIGAGVQHFISYYGTMPTTGTLTPSLLPLASGTKPRSNFSAATFRIGGSVTRRLDLELSGSISESKANFVQHDVQALIGRATTTFWITDRLGFSATADSFSEDRHESAEAKFVRNRYFAGLQFHVSPPPRRPSHIGRDAKEPVQP